MPLRLDASQRNRAFTLVELLVVISIIALLIVILLPALSGARKAAQVNQCLANQHQLAVAMFAYAAEHDDRFPVGPQPLAPQATNQLYIAPGSPWAPPALHDNYTGLGVLLEDQYLDNNRAALCPHASNTQLTNQSLDNLRANAADAFSNYLYRHLAQTSRVLIDDLGVSELDVAARAVLLDFNQFVPAGVAGPDPVVNVNHAGTETNILYLDGHAQSVANPNHRFDFREVDYLSGPVAFARRVDQILITADHAESNDPATAPVLP